MARGTPEYSARLPDEGSGKTCVPDNQGKRIHHSGIELCADDALYFGERLGGFQGRPRS